MTATLEQLEGDIWPDPEVRTSLIDSCHRLRKVPIDTLTAGDIRMLLVQRIGAKHLASRAIELLDSDPMLDASFFPGDLLIAVLRADVNRYRGFPQLRRQLVSIASRAKQWIAPLEEMPSSLHDPPALLNEYTE
jgi:hypothetical protein